MTLFERQEWLGRAYGDAFMRRSHRPSWQPPTRTPARHRNQRAIEVLVDQAFEAGMPPPNSGNSTTLSTVPVRMTSSNTAHTA
jgi:hypothetical protein